MGHQEEHAHPVPTLDAMPVLMIPVYAQHVQWVME